MCPCLFIDSVFIGGPKIWNGLPNNLKTRNVFKKDSASGVTNEGLGFSPTSSTRTYFVLKKVIEMLKCFWNVIGMLKK